MKKIFLIIVLFLINLNLAALTMKEKIQQDLSKAGVKQEIIEKNIENCFDPKTAGLHYPSLYQDMKNGRLTEIDYLNGEVSRLGKIHNIPTPVCDVITLMIHSKESVNGNK